ncbi:Predicted PurR-regulated permease PerM [Limimonas halophila]|uniref:Predicted PurR-regulated permease PerM n=1 Tax=Limimonas halophila TaxID=1082479 RepID=A0A1G7URU6_9PROT|nr:AI-2E family transporter [Limimonas halophila]SDG49819.1 Predicted PurR-regulated permease PerM [Limimonas halophila]
MSTRDGDRRFTRRLLLAIGTVALALVVLALLWRILQVLLLLFAAILAGIFFDGLARLGQRYARLPRLLALPLAFLVVVLLLAGFGQAVGSQLVTQTAQLADTLPKAADMLRERLSSPPLAQFVGDGWLRDLLPTPGQLLDQITGIFSVTIGIVVTPALVVIIAVYLAIEPELYIEGLARMVPPRRRARGREVMRAVAHALRWWLVGRVVSMLAVGVLTAMALAIAGIPAALALGVLAGMLSFVPYIGPIASVVPALLATIPGWPWQPLWVVVIYSGVQFLEGNFITPLVQKRAVAMPPVVLLTAQIAFGLLFGLMGVFLATPLAVAAMVLVQTLYIQDTLGESIRVLGEHPSRSG